jgi:hypothetical protein
MRIGIPSYQRVDKLRSLETLEKMGFTKADIVISTQTSEDYEKYLRAFSDRATVIYRKGTNDSMNRNTCLDYFDEGEDFLLIDDDIKEFCGLEVIGDKKMLYPIKTKAKLEAIAKKQFAFCEKHNSPIFAWYAVENAFFMSNTTDLRNILVGTVFGIHNRSDVRFNEVYDLKGDFEISLRLIERGFNAVRFNGFVAKADHRSAGGCESARKAGHNRIRCEALLNRYPTLVVPHPTRAGEIKFIGDTGKRK